MTQETYTLKELAATAGVPWQTVSMWKRNGTIPPKAVTPDGTFRKSFVDQLIEDGTLLPAIPPELKDETEAIAETPAKYELPKQDIPEEYGASTKTQDEFVREFWERSGLAVNVLMMPTEMHVAVVSHITEALCYGYTEYAAAVSHLAGTPRLKAKPGRPEVAPTNFQ